MTILSDHSVIEAAVMRPEDWRRWRRLRLAALAQEPEAFAETLASWTGTGDTEARWRERLMAIPLNVVLSVAGQDAGMVSATIPNAGGQVTLISLWVAPWARGRGIGDSAVQEVLAWTRERRGSDTVLSVKANNAPAIALYRRNGLVDAGASPGDPRKRLMRARTDQWR
jgi:ribosomal protein S18 acetylase RimI-like enzyme